MNLVLINQNHFRYLKNKEFSKYYINVNDEDNILLIKHLYDDGEWTDEKQDFMISLKRYYESDYLAELLNDIKKNDFDDTIKIKKLEK